MANVIITLGEAASLDFLHEGVILNIVESDMVRADTKGEVFVIRAHLDEHDAVRVGFALVREICIG